MQKDIKEDIIIAVPSCQGSVGSVALNHARILSDNYNVHLISTNEKDNNGMFNNHLVSPFSWNLLKRFCHVPNELSLSYSVKKKIKDLAQNEEYISKVVKLGADKARASANETLKLVREAIGIRKFY